MCSIKMQSVALADKSLPEDAIGKNEVENSTLLAALNNS